MTPHPHRDFLAQLHSILSEEEKVCRKQLKEATLHNAQDQSSFYRGSLHIISKCRQICSPDEFNDLIDTIDSKTGHSLNNDSPMTQPQRRLWFIGQFVELQLITKAIYLDTTWSNNNV